MLNNKPLLRTQVQELLILFPFLYMEYSLIIRLRYIIRLKFIIGFRLMGLRPSVNGLRPWHAKGALPLVPQRLRRCFAIIKQLFYYIKNAHPKFWRIR